LLPLSGCGFGVAVPMPLAVVSCPPVSVCDTGYLLLSATVDAPTCTCPESAESASLSPPLHDVKATIIKALKYRVNSFINYLGLVFTVSEVGFVVPFPLPLVSVPPEPTGVGLPDPADIALLSAGPELPTLFWPESACAPPVCPVSLPEHDDILIAITANK